MTLKRDKDDQDARAIGFKQIEYKNGQKQSNKSNTAPKGKIRMWTILFISNMTYGFFIWKTFWTKELFDAAIIFCIFFIELIFLSIDFRNIKKRQLWSILILIGGCIRIAMPSSVWQLVVALRISLFAIGFLIPFLRSYFENVRTINWISYFTSGGYIFTLMATILFGFAILGINHKFPFQCQQITSWSGKIIEKGTNAFVYSQHKQETEKEFPIEKNDNENKNVVYSFFNNLKENIRGGFINTQKSINMKVCEAIIGQVEKIYQNPIFQIGAIFGIYLLFYGIMRFVVRIVTIIGYILFRTVKFCGLYKIDKKRKEVEEVF